MFKKKYVIILVIIIATGFVLRLAGFWFDYMFDSVSDEHFANSCALRMIHNKTLSVDGCGNPYPALYTLINLPAVAVGLFIALAQNNFDFDALKQFLALYPVAPAILILRLFSVIAGTAAIFLIYKITKLLFDSAPKGLIAAAFLAVSLIPVQLAHWARAWTFVLFFALLAFYYAVLIYRTGSRKHYILNAVFTSFSFGMHYGGFFSVIFIFLGHFLGKFKNAAFSLKEFFKNNKNLYLGLGLSLFLAALWIFLNKHGVYNYLFNPDIGFSEYYRGGGLSRYFSGLFYYFEDFIKFDPVVFALLALALFFNFRKFLTYRYLLPISFCVFYVAGMVLLDFGPKPRWLLPLIAVSIPMVADFLGGLMPKFKSKAVFSLFIVVLLLPSLFFSASWDYVLTLPSTRFEAKAWVEEHIPQNSKIFLLDITSIFAVSQQGAKDLEAALAEAGQSNPRWSYLAESGQNILPGYRTVNWGQYLANPDYSEWQEFDYYILSYIGEDDYREKIALMPSLEKLKLVHQIKPFEFEHRSFREGRDAPLEYLKFIKDIKMVGPSIEIYKLK